jgi:hypothetical protein
MLSRQRKAHKVRVPSTAFGPKGQQAIVITATPVGQGRFAAQIDHRILVEASRQPLLGAARILLSQSVDPRTVITLRHAGGAPNALRSTVGAAAGLAVREGPFRPVFVRFGTAPATPLDRAPARPKARPGIRNGACHDRRQARSRRNLRRQAAGTIRPGQRSRSAPRLKAPVARSDRTRCVGAYEIPPNPRERMPPASHGPLLVGGVKDNPP